MIEWWLRRQKRLPSKSILTLVGLLATGILGLGLMALSLLTRRLKHGKDRSEGP
jgi:hypothetical protein